MSSKTVAGTIEISMECVKFIIHEYLGTHKLWVTWTWNVWMPTRNEIVWTPPRWFYSVLSDLVITFSWWLVTVDKTWSHRHDPQTRKQSLQWRHSSSHSKQSLQWRHSSSPHSNNPCSGGTRVLHISRKSRPKSQRESSWSRFLGIGKVF